MSGGPRGDHAGGSRLRSNGNRSADVRVTTRHVIWPLNLPNALTLDAFRDRFRRAADEIVARPTELGAR